MSKSSSNVCLSAGTIQIEVGTWIDHPLVRPYYFSVHDEGHNKFTDGAVILPGAMRRDIE